VLLLDDTGSLLRRADPVFIGVSACEAGWHRDCTST